MTLREYLESYDEPLNEGIKDYKRERKALEKQYADDYEDREIMWDTFKRDNSREYVKAHKKEMKQILKDYTNTRKEAYKNKLAALKEKYKKDIFGSKLKNTLLALAMAGSMFLGSLGNEYVKPALEIRNYKFDAVEQEIKKDMPKMEKVLEAISFETSQEFKKAVAEYEQKQADEFSKKFAEHFGYSIEDADAFWNKFGIKKGYKEITKEVFPWCIREYEKEAKNTKMFIEDKYRELLRRDK